MILSGVLESFFFVVLNLTSRFWMCGFISGTSISATTAIPLENRSHQQQQQRKRSVFDLQHLLFFVTRPIFSYDLTLSCYNFKTEARSPKANTSSESWVSKDSVGTGPQKKSPWKFSAIERFTPKITFLPISVSQRKVELVSTVWRPGPSNLEVRYRRFVSTKIGDFEVFFFAQNRFSWPNGQFLPTACHTYSESY